MFLLCRTFPIVGVHIANLPGTDKWFFLSKDVRQVLPDPSEEITTGDSCLLRTHQMHALEERLHVIWYTVQYVGLGSAPQPASQSQVWDRGSINQINRQGFITPELHSCRQ
jgi:hypothetical protein